MKIKIKNSGLIMVASSFYIPKGNPVKPLGEDAHFICVENQTIGVADGVGGWANMGIDSGVFSRSLMAAAAESVSAMENKIVEPMRVLQMAFSKTAGIEGASTACILSHNDGVLRCVNLGDSGFMVFRDGKLLHGSDPQQRRFNCPFQLGNHSSCERPDSAVESQVSVAAGDVVVLATDGLLDNMFVSDIEAIITKLNNDAETEELAWKIAEKAYVNSLDKYFPTPFAINSVLSARNHKGGKPDDITIVVAKIIHHYAFNCSNN